MYSQLLNYKEVTRTWMLPCAWDPLGPSNSLPKVKGLLGQA